MKIVYKYYRIYFFSGGDKNWVSSNNFSRRFKSRKEAARDLARANDPARGSRLKYKVAKVTVEL